MGFLNKLFGGADGVRETMRDSYTKHMNQARRGEIPTNDSPHIIGLYGALGSRYRARGQPTSEPALWGELAPFLLMSEVQAVEALAEYVLLQEGDQNARVDWLREAINNALRSGFQRGDQDRVALTVAGALNRATWIALLADDTREAVLKAVESMGKE